MSGARASGRGRIPRARLGPLLAVVAAGACGDPCTNRVVERRPSPGGRHDAVVFVRDCGARIGRSVQVGIVPRGQSVVGLGNTFAAERQPALEVRWSGDTTLVVRYRDAGEVSRREQVGDVRVVFDTTTAPAG